MAADPWAQFPDAKADPWSQFPDASAPQVQQQPQQQQQSSLAGDVGKYLGAIQQGLYRIPQSVIELGARGTDALGVTDQAFPAVRKAFDTGNRIMQPDQENKYVKTGDVVGQMLATAPVGALKVAQGTGYAPAIVNGIAQGMTAAGLTSSASDAPLMQQLGTGAALGGVTGAAAKGAGDLIETLGRSKAPPVMSPDDLKTAKTAAYKAADDSGVIIKQESWKRLVEDLKTELAELGIDDDINPKAMKAFKRVEGVLEKEGDHLTLKGAEIIRRVVGNVLKSNDGSERFMAYQIRDKLDEFIEGAADADLVAGRPEDAQLFKEARDLYSRLAKSEYMESLIDRAQITSSQFSGSGYENALRTQFRNLAKDANKMRRFTGDEQAAIRKVAEGGPIENALRFIGKFAPRGVVSTVLSGAAGNAVGGPAGGYGAMALGELGRRGATMATERNAVMAAELARAGGVNPVRTVDPRAQVMADLLRNLPFPSAAAVAGAK